MPLPWKKQAPPPRPVAAQAAPPPAPSLQETVIKMRLTSKRVGRMASKATSQAPAAEAKAMAEMRKHNIEAARVHALQAIRLRTQAKKFQKLSAQLEGQASIVQEMIIHKEVTGQMGNVNEALSQALGQTSFEETARVMEQFERNVTDSEIANELIGAATSPSGVSAPAEEVDTMLRQMADEVNITLNAEGTDIMAPSAVPGSAGQGQADSVEERLKQAFNTP